MTEIEFSIIGEPSPILQDLLHTFESRHNARVKLRVMNWENAWAELLSIALYARGPDVSHIGSTWSSSLTAMNSLRPFTEAQILPAGGSGAFLPQCWQSGLSSTLPGIWSLPWTSYTFLLCYRRDLLEKAGVDESSAFASAAALAKTIRLLRESGVALPWVVPAAPGFVDILHHAASWIWGAGGDYLGESEHNVLVMQHAAQEGLAAYFDLLTYMRNLPHPLDEAAAEAVFARGEAAVTILGSGSLYTLLDSADTAPVVTQNLGVVPMPGVPWIGGDSLVVWRHSQVIPAHERTAVDLVAFLVGREAQGVHARSADVQLPTRPDAFQAIPLPDTTATRAVIRSLQTGRAYRPAALWGRFESQMSTGLGRIAQDILDGMHTHDAMQRTLTPLMRRIELTMKA